jgi:anti-sigma factor RsiW
MNRTDELTDRLLDGTLTDAEAVELESLLATDPAAQARHLAAVRLELVLRGLRTEFDFAGPTVAKIEADRVERTTTAVMAELARRPTPRLPARRARLWVAVATLTAAVLVAVWLGARSPEAPQVPNAPIPAAPDVARLVSVSGSVEVVSPSGPTAARLDLPLAPDQSLRTVGEDSVAVVEFPDRTRVEVHPESVVRLDPNVAGEPGRKFVLVQGRITAIATGNRLVVGAGVTNVEASRGTFSVWSAGSGSARVEPTDGDVRVSRGTPAEPVVLGPGRAAFVSNEPVPVKIETGRIDTEPRCRLDFKALDVGFDAGGDVVAVSAKQWALWTPSTPDPGRTLFPPKVFNDGLAAWLTPDRRAVALCRSDDREERIVVRDLLSGAERGQVPIRVSEPRFLCVAPDASWVATAGGQKPNNRRIRVWDVATAKERFAFDLDGSVNCLSAAPDGRRLAVGVSDLGKDAANLVAVFDTTTGERSLELPTRRKAVTALTFSADGKHLAAGFNGVIQVWDVPGRKLVRTLEGFERTVTRVAFDTNGKLLAAGMGDGQVWVWSAATGLRTQVIETGTRGVRSLAFSADGKLLVTATNKAPVAVWEVAPEPANKPDPDA